MSTLPKEAKRKESVSKSEKTELKEEDFPTEATSKNIEDLIQKGHEIENVKSYWAKETLDLLELFSFFLFMIFILASIVLFLIGADFVWEIIKSKPPEAPLNLVQMLLFTFALGGGFLMLLIGIRVRNSFWMFILYRGFKFPKAKYEVFGWLSAMAECITKENRRKVPHILYNLRDAAKRYLAVNRPLRRSLRPDVRTLRKRRFLQNLILFSEEKELPILFLNLGLAIVHDNFPTFHTLARELESKLSMMEKKTSRIEAFLNFLETYEKPILLLIKIISFVITIAVSIVLAIHGIPQLKLPF